MLRPSQLRPIARAACRVRTCPQSRIVPLQPRRTLKSRSQSSTDSLGQDFDMDKINERQRDYQQKKLAFLLAGFLASLIAAGYTAWKLKESIQYDMKVAAEKKKKEGSKSNALQADSPIPTETFKTEAGEKRKVVLHDEQGNEIVPTGNSTVPTLPRTIDVRLPTSERQETAPGPIAAAIADGEGTEFTLVGLGTRTVTFLGIQVYVVGYYVATQDVARLQKYLVKKINPVATTLIPSEKDTLRETLRDPAEGEETWDTLLQSAGCRSIFRITPVRDTDFHHLRDGFVRAITARSQRNPAYSDEAFGLAIRDFKAIFNRGSVPKKKELLLCRDAKGAMSVMYGDVGAEGKKPERNVLGVVGDERLSRLLWLNYLAGKNVASEKARQNIIEGVMEFVERPVGTVATQVV